MNSVRKWLKSPVPMLILVVALLGLYLGRTVISIHRLNEHEHASVSYDYRYHFAVDIGKIDSTFDREFLRGAQSKADEHGIVLEVNELNSSFDGDGAGFATWVSYVRPDGMIGTDLLDGAARAALLDAGIACCAAYNDPGDANLIYVGPDNYAQGYSLAKKLADARPGEELNIALLYAARERQGAGSRLQGFLDGAAEVGLRVLERRAVEPGILRGMGIAEDVMLSFAEINCFVCLDEVLLTGAARGIVDLNRVRGVFACGIGASDEIAEYIRNGIIDFSIDVGGYAIGEIAVESLYLHKQRLLSGDDARTLTECRWLEE